MQTKRRERATLLCGKPSDFPTAFEQMFARYFKELAA
jgi:hypothetical protein